MARERSPKREKAKQMWLEWGGMIKLEDAVTLYCRI
ncbi:phage terminase small subunit-related protein [Paenibacillus polymyxa]|nr:phage terminase small subunit-related protein [Paenibacillus polymyxa]AUJ88441.1 hypothetical protein PPYC2_27105 [Paenibacillus polymyxa]POR25545.1 hypothetical protein CG775_21735 [Paenibacillus polymyxa]